MFDESTIDRHPTYGMLSFSRVTGGDPNLFGSSVQHREKIMLTLKRGEVQRELHKDWYRGRELLFELEMSYTQFAELISAMNVGDGVPVTLRFVRDEELPERKTIVNKRKQFMDEFATKIAKNTETAKKLIKKAEDFLDSKKPMNKAERQAFLTTLTALSNEIERNQVFALSQYNEAMDEIANEAKGEVEAFVETKMRSLALAALAEQNKALPNSSEIIVALPEDTQE